MGLSDLRHALRALRRTPGFAVVAALSLGLAIGITTTVFAVVDAVRHPYVPYADVERLVEPRLHADLLGAVRRIGTVATYEALREGTTVFDGLAAATVQPALLEGPSGTEDGVLSQVTAGFFDVLGVRPLEGRVPDVGEDGAVVVSERLWRRLFVGRRQVAGATLTVDGQGYSIVGVMPRGVDAPFMPDAWIPMAGGQPGARTRWVIPIGRLRAEVGPAQLRAELATVASRLATEHRVDEVAELRFAAESVRRVGGRLGAFHLAIGGAAVAVLLIACANLANLMLARGTARRRELAVRLALGAPRRALLRHLTAECVVLAVLGGVVGVVLAAWGTSLLVHLLPMEVPRIGVLEPRFGWRAVLAACAAVGTVVVLAGVLPALRVSAVDVAEPLKEGSGTTTDRSRRQYGALVVAEVALSLALLAAATVLVRAAGRIATYDFGFDARPILTAYLAPESRETDPAAVQRMHAELLDRVRRLPGVRAASLLGEQWVPRSTLLSDHPGRYGGRVHARTVYEVGPELLPTLGVPVVRGRNLTAGDAGSDAVLVDERAARLLWDGLDPIGRGVAVGDPDDGGTWKRVVGVVRTAAFQLPEAHLEAEPHLYLPTSGASPGRLVVRAAPGAMQQVGVAVRRELALTPGLRPATSVQPWLASFDRALDAQRFVTGLFATFGFAALALAMIGLYAVLSYVVSRRHREFGVRMALGARRRDVLALVLRDGQRLVLAGVALGALLSLWTSQALEAWLYDVPPTDVLALALAEVGLAVVALVASLAPALRAARSDPLAVLRAV